MVKKFFDYKKEAEKYLPRKIKYLLIAESPPEDYRNYFFYTGDENGNYCFFENIILATLNIKYEQKIHDKRKILNMFINKGFYLIDAVEYPINSLEDDKRKEVLVQNKFILKERLNEFNNTGLVYPRTKIILVKNIVCELFKDFLEADLELVYDKKFGIKCIGYPGYYSDKRFINKLKNIINE